jgi:channel protein (hemolysin III family)
MDIEIIDVFGLPGVREPVNCFTHLVAAVVFSVLGYRMVRRGRGSWIRTISLAVMACSAVFLLSMSAVYHMLGPGRGRDVMRMLDIAGVFALIAGTMTPVHAILDRGFCRWASLILVWTIAAAGIMLRTIYSESLSFEVGTGLFLLFGWGGVISVFRLWKRFGFPFVKPLLWGGVAYTLGALIVGLNWPVVVPGIVGPHELWHVAVLIGLSLHWKFVLQLAEWPPHDPHFISAVSENSTGFLQKTARTQ